MGSIRAARRADTRFSPSAEDRDAAADIGRLLRGSPLGIELAASWVKSLSCPEIDAEIRGNLDFLTSAGRDLPARHRSLHNRHSKRSRVQ